MFAALTKEEVAGREVVAPRRKKGISFTNMIEKCQRRKDYRHVLKNLFPTNIALEMSSSGPAWEYQGGTFGLYELVIGEEIEGSPVYRQAHSEEIPNDYKYLLYR